MDRQSCRDVDGEEIRVRKGWKVNEGEAPRRGSYEIDERGHGTEFCFAWSGEGPLGACIVFRAGLFNRPADGMGDFRHVLNM